MKLFRTKALGVFFLAATLTAPLWGTDTALPGTVNYIEGQVKVGDQTLNAKSVGSVDLQPGQALSTGTGKAEVLLIPGVFLRVGDDSSVKMISSNLTDTEVDVTKGQATLEVAEIHPYNVLRVGEEGTLTQLQKDGLYEFDSDNHDIQVFKGQAIVLGGDRQIRLKGGHELVLNQTAQLKPEKFNKKAAEASDLYRFSDLRSEYLAEANVDAARNYYAGGPGWYGPGWYWDPLFAAYTWIPGDGIFYSPFGWGFCSPLWAYNLPITYGGFYGRYYPGYHRGPVVARGSGPHAFSGRTGMPAARGFGVMGGGFHAASGGFHAGSGGFRR